MKSNFKIIHSYFYQKIESTTIEIAYRHFRNINFFSCKSVIIVVNIRQSHWAFVHLENENSRITYYDSLHFKGSQILNTISRFLELKRKSENLPTITYELRDTKSSPRQANFDDCGIYTIINARLIMKGITINSSSYSERYAKMCRYLFKYELM